MQRTSDLVLAGQWIETVGYLFHFHGMAFSVPDDNDFNEAVCIGALGRKGIDGPVIGTQIVAQLWLLANRP